MPSSNPRIRSTSSQVLKGRCSSPCRRSRARRCGIRELLRAGVVQVDFEPLTVGPRVSARLVLPWARMVRLRHLCPSAWLSQVLNGIENSPFRREPGFCKRASVPRAKRPLDHDQGVAPRPELGWVSRSLAPAEPGIPAPAPNERAFLVRFRASRDVPHLAHTQEKQPAGRRPSARTCTRRSRRAEQKAIQLPKEVPEDAQQQYEELQQLSDAEFGEAYMDEMVKDHEEDIELFEQQAESGEDPGSADLCGGNPANAARSPGTRKGGSVADHCCAWTRHRAEAGRQARSGRPHRVTVRASTLGRKRISGEGLLRAGGLVPARPCWCGHADHRIAQSRELQPAWIVVGLAADDVVTLRLQKRVPSVRGATDSEVPLFGTGVITSSGRRSPASRPSSGPPRSRPALGSGAADRRNPRSRHSGRCGNQNARRRIQPRWVPIAIARTSPSS
jgi:hypothetical protein